MKKIVIILFVIILFGSIDKTDKRGFYIEGDKIGYHKKTKTLYDIEGYDKDGFNEKGYDKEGYNRKGYNIEGYDRNGYDKEGYNKEGYNKNGYDKEGYDREGYDWTGYDKEKYDRNGYNKYGYDRKGYDKSGYDIKGYNKNKKFNKKEYIKYLFKNGLNIEDDLFQDLVYDFIKINYNYNRTPLKDEFEKTKDYNLRLKKFYNEWQEKKDKINNIFYGKSYVIDRNYYADHYNADNEEWIIKINNYNSYDHNNYDSGYSSIYANSYIENYQILLDNKNNLKNYKIHMNIEEAKNKKNKVNIKIKYVFKINNIKKTEITKETYVSSMIYVNKVRRTYTEPFYKFYAEILGYQILINNEVIDEVIF